MAPEHWVPWPIFKVYAPAGPRTAPLPTDKDLNLFKDLFDDMLKPHSAGAADAEGKCLAYAHTMHVRQAEAHLHTGGMHIDLLE